MRLPVVLRSALTNGRSSLRIVHSDVDVKSWTTRLPEVGTVRPRHCPACGHAGAPIGARVGLHGHGCRSRLMLGPSSAEATAEVETLTVRRYRCQACGAVIAVYPRALRPRFRYGVVAIALALVLWALERRPAAEVRAEVSPFPVVGVDAQRDWRSLRRWARARAHLWPPLRDGPEESLRDIATRVGSQLMARAPLPCGVPRIDACAGAVAR